MKWKGTILLLLFMCWGQFQLHAQYPSFFSLSVENGAPSNEIYCMLQDRDGYLWIGCDAGVYRYNGSKFIRYSSNELIARSATGLIQTQSGRIYGYNFRNQIFYVDGDSLKVLKECSIQLNGIQAGNNGDLWISGSQGTHRMSEMDHTPVLVGNKKEKKIGGLVFTDNILFHANRVYYHNSGRLIESFGKNIIAYDYLQSDFQLPCLTFGFNDRVWLVPLSGESIYFLLNKKIVEVDSPELKSLLKGRKVNNIYQYKNGELWIMSYSGIIRYDYLRNKADLLYPDLAFSDALYDLEGSLWLSTLHDGLIRIPNLETVYWINEKRNVSGDDRLTGITIGGGNIFGAGSNGSIVQISDGAYVNIHHDPVSDLGFIHYDERDKAVYFSKTNELFQLRNGRVSSVNRNGRPIKAMLHDSDGYLFLSSQGLYAVPTVEEPLDASRKILDDWIRDITKTSDPGSYFLAGNNGVYFLRTIKGRRVIQSQFVKGLQVLTLTYVPQLKRIYFLDANSELFQLDEATLTIKRVLKLDPDVRAYSIRANGADLYLATSQGLFIYNSRSGSLDCFNAFDGLPSNNVTGIVFKNDQIWLSTGKGICLFGRPKSGVNRGERLILNNVKVGTKYVRTNEIIVVDHDEALTISLDGLSFRSNGNISYTYRFGDSDSWEEVRAVNGAIRLPKLPFGRYAIHIRLKDFFGRTVGEEIVLQVNVRPPFWQRWWFYLAIVALVITTGIIFFRYRLKSIRKKQHQAIKQLQLENELRLTQQNALKAQMNPHFIFNVLNSIKGFIYESDKQNSIKYLSEFSALIRNVLDMSSKSFVSLKEELEAVELYIHLEAMLLDSDLDYSLEISDDVDMDYTRIPALLIQPYVENSFKHGLRHRQGKKTLRIQVGIDQDNVVCIKIEDNGIGRSAAAKINAANPNNHESFASEALKHRIALLNHQREDIVGVEIIDKFDQDRNPSGTIVIVRIDA